MTKAEKNLYIKTPPDTIIEAVFTMNDKVYVKEMTFEEYLTTKPKQGWKAAAFQKGFHTFKTNI